MIKEEITSGFLSGLKSIFSTENNSDEPTKIAIETYTEEYVRPSFVGTEVSTSQPMKTRTVFFENASETCVKEISKEDTVNMENLDIQFAENFVTAGGKFMYCETLNEAVSQIKLLAEENYWNHVFVWENEIKDMFCENEFQKGAIGFTIEKSSAAACLCECLIAENGSLLLNPIQSSRRRLPGFPKVQIFIAHTSQIHSTLNQSLQKFTTNHKDEVPSVLNLSSNTKGSFYQNGQLVFKADGTDDVYLILVDQLIPPSSRV